MLIADPWFAVAAVVAVLVAGISKGGVGGGLGALSVPLLSIAISPVIAAAILLPLLCVMDLLIVRAYRGKWEARHLRYLLPGAMLGIVVGALTFRYLNDDHIRLILGGIALLFSLHAWLARRRAVNSTPTVPGPHRLKALAAGTVSGFTSFVAHAGSPPFQMYLLPRRLHKTAFVATAAAYFMVLNYVKLVPYGILGQFSGANLWTTLWLLPLAPLGVWIGIWLHGRMSNELFYRIAYTLIFLAGLKLVWDGAHLGAWLGL